MIEVGTLIEFESGMQYEVIKVFSQNQVDLRATKPQFEWMPDYFPIYYSIELKDYIILKPNESKTINRNEQARENPCPYCGNKYEDTMCKSHPAKCKRYS